jgi:hypothetical protein
MRLTKTGTAFFVDIVSLKNLNTSLSDIGPGSGKGGSQKSGESDKGS